MTTSLPAQILKMGLPEHLRRLLAYIVKNAQGHEKALIGNAKLAGVFGVCERTIRYWLASLKKLGLIVSVLNRKLRSCREIVFCWMKKGEESGNPGQDVVAENCRVHPAKIAGCPDTPPHPPYRSSEEPFYEKQESSSSSQAYAYSRERTGTTTTTSSSHSTIKTDGLIRVEPQDDVEKAYLLAATDVNGRQDPRSVVIVMARRILPNMDVRDRVSYADRLIAEHGLYWVYRAYKAVESVSKRSVVENPIAYVRRTLEDWKAQGGPPPEAGPIGKNKPAKYTGR